MNEQISIWHTEQKTQDWKEYYIVLADGEQTVSFKLAHNAKMNEIRSEPYSPPDINYTIHDSCDHENYECVLDDPESSESKDVFMAERHSYALHNLLNLEKQVQQQRIAERLAGKVKEEQSEASRYNREMDERNRIIAENRDKPWLPFHDGED
jgi:hypothetical protein